LPVLLALGVGNRLDVYEGLQVVGVVGLGAWLQVDKVAIILSLTLQECNQFVQVLPAGRRGQLNLSEHLLLFRLTRCLRGLRSHRVLILTDPVGAGTEFL